MTKAVFTGPVYVVRDNIDTDQIIPAQYLNLVPTIPDEYEKLGAYALCGLPESLYPTRFVEAGRLDAQYPIVVAGKNFGCGSSREHAPIALGSANCEIVLAESFARIFRQNMFNGGLLVIELPAVAIAELFDAFAGVASPTCAVDLDAKKLRVAAAGKNAEYSFGLSPFDEALVRSGGWVEFADARY